MAERERPSFTSNSEEKKLFLTVISNLSPSILLLISAFVVFSLMAMSVIEAWDANNSINVDKLRYYLELLYFLCGAGLFFTAALALKFAYDQVKQAQKTHKATVFLEVEKRWSSREIVNSRTLIRMLHHEMEDSGRDKREWADLVHEKLTSLRNDREKAHEYMDMMEVIFFLEYLGLMMRESREYLEKEDMLALIEPLLFGYEPLFRKHLQNRFNEWAEKHPHFEKRKITYLTHQEGTFSNTLYLFDEVKKKRNSR